MTPKQPPRGPKRPPKSGSGGGRKPPIRKNPPPPKVPVFWIALGAIVAIAIGAVVFTTLGDDAKKADSGGGGSAAREFGSVTIDGRALPALGQDQIDSAIGDTMPTVNGENFDGQPATVAPNGRAQMIVFLAHWCPHCNAEAPRLASYLEAAGGTPEGTDLVIVPTGSDVNRENWPPSTWVDEMGLSDVTTLVDNRDQEVARAFGLSSYPFIVMADADGTVIGRLAGEQPEGFFAEAFDALAAGNQPPGV